MNNIPKWPSIENDNPKVTIEVCLNLTEIDDIMCTVNNLEECYRKMAEESCKEDAITDRKIANDLANVTDLLEIIRSQLT